MTVFDAVVLGVVQGLTEFLPISSDGHLSLTYKLLGMTPDLTFEIWLHFATVLAMYLYFWTDVVRLVSSLAPRNRATGSVDRRLVALIAVGTIISGVVALLLEPVVEPMSANMMWVGIWFLATASLLTLAELLTGRTPSVPTTDRLPMRRIAFIGVMQGLAVLPGLSRSGSTIAGGMMSGLTRERAARFSFLLGMPIITAATLVDGIRLATGETSLPPLPISLAGFVAAAVAGYFAMWGLLRFVRGHRLYGFAIYTAVLGAILLLSSAMA